MAGKSLLQSLSAYESWERMGQNGRGGWRRKKEELVKTALYFVRFGVFSRVFIENKL